MEYRRLGTSGLKVSRITLGCMSFGDTSRGFNEWALDDEQAEPIFRQAVESGINFWDSANVYGYGTSEEIVGRAIRKYTRREDVVLATKVYFKVGEGPGGSGLSRRAIMEQVDASLARLGTDYIDLYQIHRFDRETPAEETMEALHDVVKAGKARADQGVGSIPWSPLAKGRLARPWGGQTARSETDSVARWVLPHDDKPIADAVQAVAADRGVPMAQVALAWVLKNPVVTAPIVGPTRPGHLADAVAALDIRLTDEEVRRLEAPYTPRTPTGFE